jgi:hypothetical protein
MIILCLGAAITRRTSRYSIMISNTLHQVSGHPRPLASLPGLVSPGLQVWEGLATAGAGENLCQGRRRRLAASQHPRRSSVGYGPGQEWWARIVRTLCEQKGTSGNHE